jgi:D-arabinose 1-dehydrogenase-like Zn-dependent alcohol dehydrogenase
MDILTTLSSLTGGMSSFGEAMQYQGASTAYKQTAGLLDLQGKSVIASGDRQAEQLQIQGDKFLGRQRALYGKAGVRFSGSPALVWAESKRNINMDVMMTKLNAANKANALGFEALNQRIAAGQARTRAVMKMGEGILKIATSAAMAGGSTTKIPSVSGDQVGTGTVDLATKMGY